MATRSDEITTIIKAAIDEFDSAIDTRSVGTVIEVGDGIARVFGLEAAVASELLEFPDGVMGLALNLEEETIGAVILGDYVGIEEGDTVKTTGRVVEVPVGQALLGRVVSPLGEPLDGKGPISAKRRRPVERIAPGVITRKSVDTPVQTGIKAIDALIPIGRGQRELIIGDRQTGKTAIAIDAIINQKGMGLVCIYVAIGQKLSTVAKTVAILEQHGAMEHTIVVIAGADEPAPVQYLAPYAGAAMGEEVMEEGVELDGVTVKDSLCVYDDLTKHAWAYREMSLLLRRPPGREAYPGDVFYLHSRLLERAARLNEEHGGGSLTALPVIETQANDVSAYIPTNVISITDGQIYLETDLFNAGQRPALNVGISVSRVGSAAQTKAMKKVAGPLKLDLAQYRELAAFAQFASDLDKATRDQLTRGEKISEVIKQPQYQPLPVEKQVAILYVVTKGLLDDVPTPKVRAFEEQFYANLEAEHAELLSKLADKKELSDEIEKGLQEAANAFKETFLASIEGDEEPEAVSAEPDTGEEDQATSSAETGRPGGGRKAGRADASASGGDGKTSGGDGKTSGGDGKTSGSDAKAASGDGKAAPKGKREGRTRKRSSAEKPAEGEQAASADRAAAGDRGGGG